MTWLFFCPAQFFEVLQNLEGFMRFEGFIPLKIN